jgi:hypothetical protein
MYLTAEGPRPSGTPQLDRFSIAQGVLVYRVSPTDTPRIYVPCDASLRALLLHEHHDAPILVGARRTCRYPRRFIGLGCTRLSHTTFAHAMCARG